MGQDERSDDDARAQKDIAKVLFHRDAVGGWF